MLDHKDLKYKNYLLLHNDKNFRLLLVLIKQKQTLLPKNLPKIKKRGNELFKKKSRTKSLLRFKYYLFSTGPAFQMS